MTTCTEILIRVHLASVNYFDLTRSARSAEMIVEEAYAKWTRPDFWVQSWSCRPVYRPCCCACQSSCCHITQTEGWDAQIEVAFATYHSPERPRFYKVASSAENAWGCRNRASVVAISATSRQALPSGVPKGRQDALEVSKAGCKICYLKDDSIASA